MMWFNRSVATLITTLQLLDIYRLDRNEGALGSTSFEEPLKVAPPRTKPHPSFPSFSKKQLQEMPAFEIYIVGLKAPDLCIYSWQARIS